MNLSVPASLKTEHDDLHSNLARATRSGGATEQAAKAVAQLLHPHFLKEEEYALPPLALLAKLAEGRIEPDMAQVMALTDKLEADLPHMLAEHREIVAALKRLEEVAKAEGKHEQAHFAARLMLHARNEEEISYPAAVLVGRYLKAVLGKSGAP